MRAAIVLAAGASRRFGPHDKLNAHLRGRPLIDHAIANARASGAARVIVVVARPRAIPGVAVVRARQAANGLSASLLAGLSALRPIEREVLIFLADMPFATIPRGLNRQGADAARPLCRNRPGHPMLVLVRAARNALAIGDVGLAGKLRTRFVTGHQGNILDVDTRATLARVRRHGSRAIGRRCSPA